MARLSPPGYTPPPREPVFEPDGIQRATVKAWIQNYVTTEGKSFEYGKLASITKREFRSSMGHLQQSFLIEVIIEIDNEWHPAP